jgi:hypothetical protein
MGEGQRGVQLCRAVLKLWASLNEFSAAIAALVPRTSTSVKIRKPECKSERTTGALPSQDLVNYFVPAFG